MGTIQDLVDVPDFRGTEDETFRRIQTAICVKKAQEIHAGRSLLEAQGEALGRG